jgi:hypothetical protein
MAVNNRRPEEVSGTLAPRTRTQTEQRVRVLASLFPSELTWPTHVVP